MHSAAGNRSPQALPFGHGRRQTSPVPAAGSHGFHLRPAGNRSGSGLTAYTGRFRQVFRLRYGNSFQCRCKNRFLAAFPCRNVSAGRFAELQSSGDSLQNMPPVLVTLFQFQKSPDRTLHRIFINNIMRCRKNGCVL